MLGFVPQPNLHADGNPKSHERCQFQPWDERDVPVRQPLVAAIDKQCRAIRGSGQFVGWVELGETQQVLWQNVAICNVR